MLRPNSPPSLFENSLERCGNEEGLTQARKEQKKENHEKKKIRPCRSSGLKSGSDKAFPVAGFTAGDERQKSVGIRRSQSSYSVVEM